MIVFKKEFIKNKFFNTYYAYKENQNTGVFVSASNNHIYCAVDLDSNHFETFTPKVVPSFESGKKYIRNFFENEHN